MKDIGEQILEIIRKHWTNHLYPFRNQKDIASEIESLIKENYVEKEFVKWYNDQFDLMELPEEAMMCETLDELHDYWLKEIKK